MPRRIEQRLFNTIYMGKRRKDYPLIEGLEITTLAAEGKAMGKHENQGVFVPMTVPGDVVDVQIRKHHR